MNRPQSEPNGGAPKQAPDSRLARVVMRALLNKTDDCRAKCPGIGGDVDAMNLRAMLERGEFDAGAVRQAQRGLLALASSLDIEAGDECGAVDELLNPPKPERITLCEAIDAFPILRDYREGMQTDGTRAWIEDAQKFCMNASRRGSGAHLCAQYIASLAGFNIGQFNLAELLARVDSEHKKAARQVFARYMEASGF